MSMHPDLPLRTASLRLRRLLEDTARPRHFDCLSAIDVFEEFLPDATNPSTARLERVQSRVVRTLYRLLESLNRGEDWTPIRKELTRYLDELEVLSGAAA